MVAVRQLRERLGIAGFDPAGAETETVSVKRATKRLKINGHSVLRLIREGVLPTKQLLPCAPWQIPVAALETEKVALAVKGIIARRPRQYRTQEVSTLKLPGF